MVNIYKVILYYYCGDARPERGPCIYVFSDHTPTDDELYNNSNVQEAMKKKNCEYIGEVEILVKNVNKDKLKEKLKLNKDIEIIPLIQEDSIN